MPIFLGLTLTNGAVNKPAQPSSLELPSWTLFFRSRWHFLMVQHDLRPWGLSLILRTTKKPVAPDEPAPIIIPVHSYGQLWARCPKLRPVRISCLSPYGKWAWLQIPRCGIHANRNRNKWDLWEGAMKCANIALFFVIASLFLLLAPHRAVTAPPGTTVELTVPSLPGGGWGDPQGWIRSILAGIEGVLKYDLNAASSTVTVTFHDKKTSVEKIIEKLSKAGYPVSGEPHWVR